MENSGESTSESTEETEFDDYVYEDAPQEEQEESPILVAQRYLNIFHQIHIFSPEKQAEFDQSLLAMSPKTKELMLTIPGGRILLEHVKEIQEKQGKKSDLNELLKKGTDAGQAEPEQDAVQIAPTTATAVMAGGAISVGPDFAKKLADSLAIAFKNNNLVPQNNNINELSSILSRSFSSYANNMQQMTSDLLSKNIQQFNELQTRLQTQFSSQLQQQSQFQTKLLSHLQSQTVQMQTTPGQAVQTATSAASVPMAQQLNAQSNNTNSTTINNVNIDSSAFNGLAQTIRDSSEKNHEDFMRMIEVLNKRVNESNTDEFRQMLTTLNKNFTNKNNDDIKQIVNAITKNFSYEKDHRELPVKAITTAITDALKENNKQQIAAIKAFGETLSQSIIQSQKELSKTFAKSQFVAHQSHHEVEDSVDIEDKTESGQSKFMKAISEKFEKTKNKITQNLSNTDKQNNKKEKEKEKEKNKDKNNRENNQETISQDIITQNRDKTSEKSTLLDSTSKIKQQSTEETNTAQPQAKEKNGAFQQKEEKKPSESAVSDQQQSQQDGNNFSAEDNINEQEILFSKNLQTQPIETEDIDTILKDNLTDEILPLETNDASSDKKETNVFSTAPSTEFEEIDLTALLSSTPSEADNSLKNAFTEQNIATNTDILAKSFNQAIDKPSHKEKMVSQVNSPQPEKSSDVTETGTSDKLSQAFNLGASSKPLSQQESSKQQEPKTKAQTASEPEPKVQVAPRPKPRSHLYDDAMQKIKDAIHSDAKVSLNDLEVNPVSLGGNGAVSLNPSTDDDLLNSFLPTPEKEIQPDNVGWEYFDENGNPVEGEDGDWEYVDENGNPVEGGDGDWEYVDENGNPVEGGDGDWEYVDENRSLSGNDKNSQEEVDTQSLFNAFKNQ